MTKVTDGDWWFTGVELVHGAAESLGSKWQEGPKVSGVAERLEPRNDQRSTETPKIVSKLLLIGRLVGTVPKSAEGK